MLKSVTAPPNILALPQPTYADLLVDFIHQMGIDAVFGVPGGAIEPLYDALARSGRSGGPSIFTARHESGAAFMADGYYRESGKMGVVCATTGPGSTNLITGVSSALAENIPMLVITAQTALPKFGRRALQDSSCSAIDTVAMLKHCTVFNTLISHPDQLKRKLIGATMSAHRKPGGPAHISIPSDILREASPSGQRFHVDLFSHHFAFTDAESIARLCQKIAKVDSMAVYIDGSVGPATASVIAFCEATHSPFVVGLTGKYWVDEEHPLYRGVYGFAGHSSAKQVFHEEVDLVLAVGAAMDELSTSGWDIQLLNSKLVHIDSNIEHFSRSPMANLHVGGDIEATFAALLRFVQLQKQRHRSWLCCHTQSDQQRNIYGGFATLEQPLNSQSPSSPIHPQRLMAHLSAKLPENSRIFIDAGNAWAWVTHYYCNRSGQGYLRSGMGLGAMTWSLGAAIGSAIANPNAPTFCLVGDGAYLMSAQEITVALEHQLAIIVIVLNDSAYGMVMHGQRLGGAEAVGWQLPQVDYAALARALGIHGVAIDHPDQLEQLDYDALLKRQGPTLLDIRIDREAIPPMTQRVKGLALSSTPGG